MRTISTEQSTVLSRRLQSEHMRVQVYDSNAAAWRDLTTWPGVNLVDSASWREDVDSPHATADIVLKREVEKLSLSPFVADSALNRAFDPAASAVPLLALGREIKIDVAIVPIDSSPAAGDWMMCFHGYIDTIDPAKGATISVECRDLGARVMDTFIETERVYSYGAAGVAMRVWEPSTVYALNEYILPSESKRNGKYYKVTTAGTSGATEPTWPASSTVADNTAVHTYESTTTTAGTDVEDVMQSILDNSGLSVTLDVPSSPAWAITQFIQQRQGALEAIRKLAQQIGWDVRYVWKAASSDFVLRLFEPDRDKAVADRTFTAADYVDFQRLAIDISGIRNAIRVIYSDAADTWPDGTPKRKVVEATDTDSITAYGRRFMEIAEDSASQIDSSDEANLMAAAALSDLAEPTAEAEVEMAQGFPWVELGDLYAFSSNGRHFDSTQTLAVYGWSHSAQDGHIKTTLQLRGKPSGGRDRWLSIGVTNTGAKAHARAMFQSAAGSTVAVTPTVGGARVAVSVAPDKLARTEEYEHHVSPTASFTPSASTLVAIGKSRVVELANLIPGKTYYTKSRPRTWNAERVICGQFTAEQTFVAGRAGPTHLNPDAYFGTIIRNYDFGAQTFASASSPPDGWEMNTGVWDTDATIETTTVRSGVQSLKLKNTSVAALIKTDYFPVLPSVRYILELWAQSSSTTAGNACIVQVEWYSAKASLISTDEWYVDNSVANDWTRLQALEVAPSNARFARVRVGKESATAYSVLVDYVRFDLLDLVQEDWHEVGSTDEPAFSNSWANYGGSDETAAFFKDGFGVVHLKGTVKSGTDTLIFTLPAGYRPAALQKFAIVDNITLAVLAIDSSGLVYRVTGGNTSLPLNGITFRAA